MNLDKVRAKKLYAECKSAEEIAKALGKSKNTIYRWIKENKEEFENSRKLAQMSTDNMKDLLDENHKKLLLEIIEKPNTLADPKTADALIKIANVLEKMDIRAERERMNQLREEKLERGVVFVDDIEKQTNQENIGVDNSKIS